MKERVSKVEESAAERNAMSIILQINKLILLQD
jgi:hypothetical protein